MLQPEKLRPFVGELAEMRPDAIVVASYGKILPQAILDLAPLGAFNVHPSLLPLYRGATPLQSALRDGRAETGVTIMMMDAGMDTGDILLQETRSVAADETYGTLHDRLARDGAKLLATALDHAQAGKLTRISQDALGIAKAEIVRTLTRPLTKDDLLIDWRRGAEAVANQVRSLAPQPLARTLDVRGEPLKIAAVHVVAKADGTPPDAIFESHDGRRLVIELRRWNLGTVGVETRDAWVVLDRVVPAGKAEMSGERYGQMIADIRRRAHETLSRPPERTS